MDNMDSNDDDDYPKSYVAVGLQVPIMLVWLVIVIIFITGSLFSPQEPVLKFYQRLAGLVIVLCEFLLAVFTLELETDTSNNNLPVTMRNTIVFGDLLTPALCIAYLVEFTNALYRGRMGHDPPSWVGWFWRSVVGIQIMVSIICLFWMLISQRLQIMFVYDNFYFIFTIVACLINFVELLWFRVSIHTKVKQNSRNATTSSPRYNESNSDITGPPRLNGNTNSKRGLIKNKLSRGDSSSTLDSPTTTTTTNNKYQSQLKKAKAPIDWVIFFTSLVGVGGIVGLILLYQPGVRRSYFDKIFVTPFQNEGSYIGHFIPALGFAGGFILWLHVPLYRSVKQNGIPTDSMMYKIVGIMIDCGFVDSVDSCWASVQCCWNGNGVSRDGSSNKGSKKDGSKGSNKGSKGSKKGSKKSSDKEGDDKNETNTSKGVNGNGNRAEEEEEIEMEDPMSELMGRRGSKSKGFNIVGSENHFFINITDEGGMEYTADKNRNVIVEEVGLEELTYDLKVKGRRNQQRVERIDIDKLDKKDIVEDQVGVTTLAGRRNTFDQSVTVNDMTAAPSMGPGRPSVLSHSHMPSDYEKKVDSRISSQKRRSGTMNNDVFAKAMLQESNNNNDVNNEFNETVIENITLVLYEFGDVLLTNDDKYEDVEDVDAVKQFTNSEINLTFGGPDRIEDLQNHFDFVISNNNNVKYKNRDKILCFLLSNEFDSEIMYEILKRGKLSKYFQTAVKYKQYMCHVIGRNHFLKKDDEKEYLTILKIMHILNRSNENVLYIGHRQDLIEHLNTIDACHTYYVKTKGMTIYDIDYLKNKFIFGHSDDNDNDNDNDDKK